MVDGVRCAVVFYVAVFHILDLNMLYGITEGEDITGLVSGIDGKRIGYFFRIECLQDAASDSECPCGESDCLKLESVVAETVGGKRRVKTLHEVCGGTL